MRVEEREIKTYKEIYIANDGTEFATQEQCEEYEKTAQCAIEAAFKSLPMQCSHNIMDSGFFPYFGCDDSVYAIKIRNVNDLEIVNKWLIETFGKHGDEVACLGADAIGTIQLIETYDYDNEFFLVGTPESLREHFMKGVDRMIEELVGKGEKGENE